jgi:hypothetical protein
MSVRKRERNDRAPTILDLLDRELNGVEISYRQLVPATLRFQDDRGQRFEPHPLQGHEHM